MTPTSGDLHPDIPTLEARIRELEQQLATATGSHAALGSSEPSPSKHEARLAIALEVTGAGCFDVDLTTGEVWLSNQYLAIMGYDPGERQFSFDEWMSLGHPDDAAAVLPQANACLNGLAPSYSAETRLRCKDGSWVWVNGQGRVVGRDESGRALRLVGTIVDITARRAAEDRLRQFEQLVEHAPIGLALADTDGHFLYANPACEASYGCPEGLVGKHYRELLAPGEHERLATSMTTGTAAGSWEGRVRHQRHDGSSFPVHIASVALVGSDGTPRGAAAILRDLSVEAEAEGLLRRFQLLAENAPMGFSFTELDGRIQYLNPAFRALLGYTDTPVGAPLLQFFAPQEHERIPQLIEVLVQQGSWQGPITYCRSDGSTFDAELNAFLLRDATGSPTGLAGIARDLTEEQQREQEQAQLQEQVIAAQQAALRELSTPLIPLARGVVAMPLIGSIDSGRAQQVLETLLEGVAASSATTAIIDITGVPVVDTQVANALIRAAQAVKLLGASVVLTGIRPEVAQTLVGLGADLSSINTRSSLQAGITFAMERRQSS